MEPFKYIQSVEYWNKAIPSMDYLAGAREYVLTDGPARGLRAIDVYTGSGFEFTVLPDRGMDIAHARFNGVPIAYVTKMGLRNSALCGLEGRGEFLRYFMGGLVTTCGLDNAGGECTIDGMFYPMHGRHTMTPAQDIRIERFWERDKYYIAVSGSVRLAALFHENLLMQRRIKASMGESKVVIEDIIINESGSTQQYMLMYHCNFGFPLVSPDSRVMTNHKRAAFLDDQSERLNIDRSRFVKPQGSYEQSAFTLHEPADTIVKSAVINPEINLGAYVECDERQLGSFTQWIQLAEQDYVLGLEPGKNTPVGRKKAIETGSVISIQPGEQHGTRVDIGILRDNETAEYEQRIAEELKRS